MSMQTITKGDLSFAYAKFTPKFNPEHKIWF